MLAAVPPGIPPSVHPEGVEELKQLNPAPPKVQSERVKLGRVFSHLFTSNWTIKLALEVTERLLIERGLANAAQTFPAFERSALRLYGHGPQRAKWPVRRRSVLPSRMTAKIEEKSRSPIPNASECIGLLQISINSRQTPDRTQAP